MKNSTIVTAFVASMLLTTGTATAAPILGFTGAYDVSTWTTQNAVATDTFVAGVLGTGGSVDTSSAPGSIILTEPNNNTGQNYEIQFLNTAAGDGIFSFDWAISGSDPCCGSANVYIGDTSATGWDQWSNDLTDVLWASGSDPFPMSGTFSGSIVAGQAFGFAMATADDCCGAITLTISNFSAPGASVPEPSTLVLLGLGLVGLGWRQRNKAA